MSISYISIIILTCLFVYAAYIHYSGQRKLQKSIDSYPEPNSITVVSKQTDEKSNQTVFSASYLFYNTSKLDEVSEFLVSIYPNSDIEIAQFNQPFVLEAIVIKWCSKSEFNSLESRYEQVENEFNLKFNKESLFNS